jgi:acyl carrier protein
VNESDLRSAVLAALQEIAPEADLTRLADDADIRDELDLDSMDFLNFAIGIHERTGFDVPERDYPRLATLSRALTYLSRKLASTK